MKTKTVVADNPSTTGAVQKHSIPMMVRTTAPPPESTPSQIFDEAPLGPLTEAELAERQALVDKIKSGEEALITLERKPALYRDFPTWEDFCQRVLGHPRQTIAIRQKAQRATAAMRKHFPNGEIPWELSTEDVQALVPLQDDFDAYYQVIWDTEADRVARGAKLKSAAYLRQRVKWILRWKDAQANGRTKAQFDADEEQLAKDASWERIKKTVRDTHENIPEDKVDEFLALVSKEYNLSPTALARIYQPDEGRKDEKLVKDEGRKDEDELMVDIKFTVTGKVSHQNLYRLRNDPTTKLNIVVCVKGKGIAEVEIENVEFE